VNPLTLHVLVVTTTLRDHEQASRAFVNESEYRLRELGNMLVADKPEEALHVEYVLMPAEGVE
jgi:hypothetical protein